MVLGSIPPLLYVLITEKVRPPVAFFLLSIYLVVIGAVELQDFLNGFSNSSIATIFALILITVVIREHFNVLDLLDRFFYRAKSGRGFLFRMGLMVSAVSSVLNNTPVVALLIPYVNSWGRKAGINPSKLLMPLSFMAIAGGMITLIGTSTNLVLNGLLQQNDQPVLGFGAFFIPGVLVTLGGLIYLVLIGFRLLPDRGDLVDQLKENIREYLVAAEIENSSVAIGRSVLEAGLRNLQGIFLLEIIREDKIISPVGPDEILEVGDTLVFAGDIEAISVLVKSEKGVSFSKHASFHEEEVSEIVEAVVPSNSILAGKMVRESNFRERYHAGILSIYRNGERLHGRIGDVRLQSGDLLLMVVGAGFERSQEKDLLVLQKKLTEKRITGWRKPALILISAIIVGMTIIGITDLFMGSILILATMILFRFLGMQTIRKEFDFGLLMILVGALTLGKALIGSGAGEIMGHTIISTTNSLPSGWVLLSLFVLTFILTSLVTNVAAVSIAFPLAVALLPDLGIPTEAVYLNIAFAASCAFATPIGYQTNLMVYGPGQYRFMDFVRVGLPLSVIYMAISLAWICWKYQIPFS
jgi:di/tricarboxylate transporter